MIPTGSIGTSLRTAMGTAMRSTSNGRGGPTSERRDTRGGGSPTGAAKDDAIAGVPKKRRRRATTVAPARSMDQHRTGSAQPVGNAMMVLMLIVIGILVAAVAGLMIVFYGGVLRS